MVIGFLKKTLVVGAVCTGISFAQQVGLSARTDSTNFRIGDWIYLHVDGTVAANVDTIAPAVRDSLGPFEVLGIARDQNKPSWIIRLMTVDTGTVFVPPVAFEYRLKGDTTRKRAYTNPVALNVKSISIDPKGDIKDIKPPVSAPWTFRDFLPYLIALVLLAAAGYGYYYYRKKQREKLAAYVPPKPKIAPHTAALYALRELEEKRLWQNGHVKQFYSEATDIIRTFFERRWNFIALELTTDEILHHMKRFPESETVWNTMQPFFITADLVKFAKYIPTPEENENELKWAYEIVRAMTPSPVAVEEEEQQTEETVNAG
jgi:hypothetical protein